MIHVKNLGQNIIHVTADTQIELSMAFIRPQEYYENQAKHIRGKYFTLEEVLYATSPGGRNTYFQDIVGFNIPGEVFQNWIADFSGVGCGINHSESRLVDAISKVIKPGRFYIIGTFTEDVLTHELAHALYCLNRKYKTRVTELVDALPYKKEMFKLLRAKSYANLPNILVDETQAYMTSSKHELITDLNFNPKWKWDGRIKKLLEATIKSLKINTEVVYG